MATFSAYAPTGVISKAMFNFDDFDIPNFRLTGTVRVSFSDSFSVSDYQSFDFYSELYTAGSNEVVWPAQMIANAQQIFGIFSQFANIPLQWAGDFDTNPPGSDATPNPRDVGLAGLSDINLSWIQRADADFAGISGAGSDDLLGYAGGAGDIFLNRAALDFSGNLDLNTRSRQVLMHEIGHSLGLSHPHSAYNNGSPTITADYAATRSLGFNQLGFRTVTAADMYKEYFTIMSYDDQQSVLPGSNALFHAHTPMILDVIALQEAYGEGIGTTGAGSDVIDAGTAGYRTYFDPGGTDTIDLSQYETGAHLQMGVNIAGAPHLVGVLMNTTEATTLAVLGRVPANLRWFYGEYENATGGANADVILGSPLGNVINGLAGNDRLDGKAGDDNLLGGDGTDSVYGSDGSDTLAGGAGNDLLYGGSALWSDALLGGPGDDYYEISNGASSVAELAGEGIDTVLTYASFTTLAVHVEYLTLDVSAGNADANGSSLGDTLSGNTGNNRFWAFGGDDLVLGGDGSDILMGMGGNDVLYAGSGLWTDTLIGGTGDDVYELHNAASTVTERAGEGTDTARSDAAYTTLWDNVENLLLLGAGNNGVNGNALNNTITGNVGNNSLYGFAGDDLLLGSAGSDFLLGMSGTDFLQGGVGNDTHFGGAGADTIDFNSLAEGFDTVTDFTRGVGGDRLDVRDVLVGYNPGASAIGDFVRLSESGGSTTVSIDANGAAGGASFSPIVSLQGVAGVLLNDLLANGNLVVS